MTTIRVYNKNTRIATGKNWKNLFLQVYPSMIEYDSEAAWRDVWTKLNADVIFEVNENRHKNKKVSYVGKSNIPSAVGWQYETNKTNRSNHPFIAPAGKYYIGDLCYAVYDHIYSGVFGGYGYVSGIYTKKNSFFLVEGTAYGDGTYVGSDGYKYNVDAGIIGICTADLIDDSNKYISGGRIIEFSSPVRIHMGGGYFSFESNEENIEIETSGEDYDDDDECY